MERSRWLLCLAAGLAALVLAACSTSSTTSASPTPTGTDGAHGLQADFVSVAAAVDPSVVLIETSGGLGSGVVFDNQGDVVTNNHVASSGPSPVVVSPGGKQAPATLLGTFAPDDLAVMRVKGLSLKPAVFADSSKLVKGDIVLAIGNPLGLQTSVTQGIVSALGRTVPEPGGSAILNAIQTSADINPGNSGGALSDIDGHVVGIPTLAATDPQLGGTAPGISFAIPANTVKDIATQIITSGKVTNSHRAYLGVTVGDITPPIGVVVYAVQPGGPAAAAGIQPGDIITQVASQPVPSGQEFAVVVAGLTPGQKVPVQVLHADGSTATLTVTVGQYPG